MTLQKLCGLGGLVLFAALSLPSGAAQLQVPEVQYPKIAMTGKDAAAFAPKGWVVEMQQSGDLNGDGRPDLAFVLHDTEKQNLVSNRNMGAENMDTNPRILCVAIANANATSFTLILQNHKLIPRWIYPNQDDNFGSEGGEIKIARGALQVSLHYFSSMGGWDTGTTTFIFRLQHDRFELIGHDNKNLKRSSGTETLTSVNYSTGRKTILTREVDGRAGTKRKTLPKHALLTIDQVGDGMEFQVPE